MIEFKNLWHHYGAAPTLKGVNLHIPKGELMVVMGPNGMGKSTLLKCAAGLHAPFKGEIYIDGQLRRSSEEIELKIRQNVFYLPDNLWMPVLLSPRIFLLQMGELYSRPEEEVYEHAIQLLQLFNLSEKADGKIASLSMGQKKKLSLCAALISNCKTLILDEPFSGGLDSSALLILQKLFRQMADNEQVTILMAVPVPELVEKVADRIAVIADGEILACGSMQELREKHNTEGDLGEILETLIASNSIDHLNSYLKEFHHETHH